MYLVGTFERDYFEMSDNSNPMSLVGTYTSLTKDQLRKTVEDDNYQVIDLNTMKYYDPKKNEWVKIQSWDK